MKKGEGKGNKYFLFTPPSPRPTRGLLPPALDLTLPPPSDPNRGSGLKHTTATNPFPKGPQETPCHNHNPCGGSGAPHTTTTHCQTSLNINSLIQTSSTARLFATPQNNPLSRESSRPFADHTVPADHLHSPQSRQDHPH